MTKILETYDPDWKQRYDHHRAVHQALLDQVRAMRAKAEGRLPLAEAERIAELLEQGQTHALAWQKAELSGFRTIHDYAESRFGYLAEEAADAGVPFVMPTFDDDDSLEDAMIDYRRISQAIDAVVEHDGGKYLPEGRPNGLDIFEPGEDRYLCSVLRVFEGGRFHPGRVMALISFDLRPAETHICLGEFPIHPDGAGLGRHYERILEVLYQEALDVGRSRPKPWAEWFVERVDRWSSEGFDAFCYPQTGLTPANMHVYAYTPPERGQELFVKLDLDLYRHPPVIEAFHPLDCAPAYIRGLRYEKAFRRAEPPVTVIA